jgi:DNA-binding transcriptional LysR family regulator
VRDPLSTASQARGRTFVSAQAEPSERYALPASVDVRELRYFSVLCEELHFGRAAARLHISQPPLSQAIAQLEQKLGTRLLERTTRQVRVTPAGKVLVAHAVRLLGELDDAVGATRRAAEAETGTLRVGTGLAARETVLPALSYVASERFPELSLETSNAVGDEVLRLLRTGGVDLGLVISPGATEGLGSRAVRRDRPVAVVHAGSALAEARSVRVAELARHELLVWPRAQSAGSHDVVLELFAPAKPAEIAARELYGGGWWRALRAGAFAVLPEATPLAPEYVRIPIADARVSFETHVMWNTAAPPTYLGELLAAFDAFALEEGWLTRPASRARRA